MPSTINCGLKRTGIGWLPPCCTRAVDITLVAFRLDAGTTAANEPACGAYDGVIEVLFDDTFVAIDDVFVVIDCKTAVDVTIFTRKKIQKRLNYQYKIEINRCKSQEKHKTMNFH